MKPCYDLCKFTRMNDEKKEVFCLFKGLFFRTESFWSLFFRKQKMSHRVTLEKLSFSIFITSDQCENSELKQRSNQYLLYRPTCSFIPCSAHFKTVYMSGKQNPQAN